MRLISKTINHGKVVALEVIEGTTTLHLKPTKDGAWQYCYAKDKAGNPTEFKRIDVPAYYEKAS